MTMNAYTIILEKNERFRQTLKMVLVQQGLTVLTPVGIKQCRKMVAAYRPGLILINFDGPGSEAFITEIRSGYPEIQILVLAAAGVQPEQTRRIKAFADDVILTDTP